LNCACIDREYSEVQAFGDAKGPSIYDVHTEGVKLRWTGEGEVQPHVDVHTEN